MVSPRATRSFVNGASSGKDIAASDDGMRLYTASGAPYLCSSIALGNLGFISSVPGGDAYPNNVEVTIDGRAIQGRKHTASQREIAQASHRRGTWAASARQRRLRRMPPR